MPRRQAAGNVRQLGNRNQLSRSKMSDKSRLAIGDAVVELLQRGMGVYVKLDKSWSELKVKVYDGQDQAEGWYDVGEPVLEELSSLLEELTTAQVANDWYERVEREAGERASEAPKPARRGRNSANPPSVAPEPSEGP